MLTDLRRLFPGLQSSAYQRTSPPTSDYNCIAWAAGDYRQWWEPDPYNLMYWPEGVPRQASMSAYVAAFAAVGYERCQDGNFEAGIEKVAIYSTKGVPLHAARQLESGLWTSKLGELDDISHSLEALEGQRYGKPTQFLRRKIVSEI